MWRGESCFKSRISKWAPFIKHDVMPTGKQCSSIESDVELLHHQTSQNLQLRNPYLHLKGGQDNYLFDTTKQMQI
jgi:hypothetical protein